MWARREEEKRKKAEDLERLKRKREEKEASLQYLMLLKEKRCGKIKGRTCADGSSQRAYIPREEATSPTVSMESLIATLIIDAKEQNIDSYEVVNLAGRAVFRLFLRSLYVVMHMIKNHVLKLFV